MEDKDALKKSKIISAISAICSIILLSAVTYATLTLIFEGGTNQIIVGKLVLTYDDASHNALSLSTLPMSNTNGAAQTDCYSFTLENEGHGTISYSIEIVSDSAWESSFEGLILNNNYVTIGITKNNTVLSPINLGTANGVIDSGTIAASTTNTYELRIWVNEDDVTSQTKDLISEATWHGKLAIHGEQSL
ncbi:MAG TPA: hypothetical protein PLT65_01970 [Bacilli bacterium]|nr:hypothetical protein [Bacilli bacterium]